MAIAAKQTINQDWDFTVVQEPLTLPSGRQSKVFANVRTDTGEELGYCRERNSIVNSADLVEKAEEAFQRKG